MPYFEANMNYIPPSPPSSMKQCNKSATVKFHMELLLTTTTRKQSRSGATPLVTHLWKQGVETLWKKERLLLIRVRTDQSFLRTFLALSSRFFFYYYLFKSI